MSVVEETTAEATAAASPAFRETHIVCMCNVDRALCGTDVSHLSLRSPSEQATCAVCADMEWAICPFCGAYP